MGAFEDLVGFWRFFGVPVDSGDDGDALRRGYLSIDDVGFVPADFCFAIRSNEYAKKRPCAKFCV